jgi:TP901 family phage tail tape measure protein
MDKVEKSTVQLIIDGQTSKVSLKELGTAVKTLKQELRQMKEADDPKAWADKVQQLKAAGKAYADAKDRIRELSQEGQRFKASWKDVFTGFLGGSAVMYVLQTLGNLVTAAKEKIYTMSDSLSEVGKATDLSKKQVRELNSELADLDTRTFVKDLREIGIIAGKNGVQKDLGGFIESVDKINVAFGDEFSSVTELSETMVNLRKIFSDIQSDDIGDDVLHIGNAMNFLADAGTASGKVMADFASRMGGTLIPLGASTGEILGLATTMEELSITAERGSTAVNTIFQKMLTDVSGFAKVAGVSTKEFGVLLNTDIWSAFNLFIKGAKAGGAQATQFAKILADAELTGSGASEVVMKLASNQDLLAKYVSAANQTLTESASITKDFNKQNNNAAAIWDKFLKIGDNALERIAIGVMDVIEVVGPWLLNLGNLSKKFEENRGLIQALTTAIMFYYANVIKATLATSGNTVAIIANRIALAASVPLYSLAGTGLRLMTIGHQLLTGQITLGTAATRVFAMAQKSLLAIWAANPLGVVIVGLSAAAGALKLYSDNTREALELERSKYKFSKELAKATGDNEKAQKLLNERLGDYNVLSEKEQQQLRSEITLRRQKLAAQLKNIEAQKVELSGKAADPSTWQKFMALAKGTIQGGGTSFGAEMASAAADNMQSINEQFNGQVDGLRKSLEDYDSMFKQMDRMEKAAAEQAEARRKAKLANYDPEDPKKGKAKKDKPSMFSERHKYEMAEAEYDQKRADQKKAFAQAEAEYDQKKIDDLKSYIDAEKEFDIMMAEREARQNLDLTSNALNQAEATGQLTPEAANRAKLDAEEAYLMELYMIRKTYGQDTADLEQSLAEASIERSRQVTENEKANSERQRELALNLQTAKVEALEMGVGALKSYFKETSLIYKGLFLVEKAAAIANVIIKSQAEIAASSAYAATLGPVAGPIYAAAAAAATKIRTGISIATIAAQSVQAFVPGREDGGYTDMNSLRQSSNPQGYVKSPTLFNLGERSFIAGENYKQEYVVSSALLKDPYFAAQAEQMEMFRMTGKHPMSGAGADQGSGQSSNVEALIMMQVEESRRLRIALESGAIKLLFNSTAFEEHQKYIDYIRESTAL